MRISKSVTLCKDCGNRVYDYGVGFTSSTKLMCGERCVEVDPDDGCTFGIAGDGGYVSRPMDVSIEGREAVNGYHYYY